MAALVGRELGKPFTPSRVWRVAALPKTRSAKIMRRAIRAAALGSTPGTCPVPKTPMRSAKSAESSRTRVHPSTLSGLASQESA